MKRGTDRQELCAFRAPVVSEACCALHGRGVTRNNNLLRRVDVGGFANLALRRIAANRSYFFELHAENGRHRAHTDRNGFLHIFAAMTYGADCIGETQSSGSDVRRVFAQAMSGDESGLETLFVQNAPGRYGRGQNRRLRDLGQTKLLFGTFEAKLGELVAQGLVGFFKCLPGYRMFFGQFFSHADGLRSLAGEKKREIPIRM